MKNENICNYRYSQNEKRNEYVFGGIEHSVRLLFPVD